MSGGNIFSLGFRRHLSYIFTAGKKLYIGYWQLLTMFTPPDWKSEHMAITGAKPTVVPLKGTPLKSTQKEHEMALRHWRRQAERCAVHSSSHSVRGTHCLYSAGHHSRATKPWGLFILDCYSVLWASQTILVFIMVWFQKVFLLSFATSSEKTVSGSLAEYCLQILNLP